MLRIPDKKLDKNAFALIELLITISIFAMVVAVVYSTFYIGIKAYRRTQEQLIIYREIDQVLDRLSQELRNCYNAEYDEANEESGFIGDSSELSFSSIIDVYSEGNLTEMLARITYSFEEGAILKKIQKDKDVFSDSEEAREEELLSDIKQTNLEYIYYENDSRESFIWENQWINKSLIPKGIMITITKMNKKSDTEVNFRRFIYIDQGQVGEPIE